MDLGAYAQIEDLEFILEKQNIKVPRLRGLRLMKEENVVPQMEIDRLINEGILQIVERIVEQNCLNIWSSTKDDTRNDILIRNKDREVIGYHWNKIHGKKRKRIKFEIKKIKKEYQKQYDLFNSFAGKDVLYVHARIGGGNWDYFEGWKLTKHPDYLGHCDDAWDGTYCDLYFQIRKVDDKGDQESKRN